MGIQYPALSQFRRVVEANAAERSKPQPQPSKDAKQPPKYPTDYSAARVELIKKLWAEGLSASQIAAAVGNITRNAVIGKVHRLGLSGRSPRKPARVAIPPRPRAIILKPVLPRSKILAPVLGETPPRAPRVIPELEQAPDGQVRLVDLKESTCHWPIGDPMEEGFHFCGRSKSSGVPYCAHHAAIAYNPAKPKRKQKNKNGFYWLDLKGRNKRAGVEKAGA